MVQGCDINILDMKPPSISKSIKVQVPTEEQKRLAQLSHIERIDNLEDSIIKQMVEITNHSYDECAMQLRGTNMDMESAITNIIEGNSEEWETTKKKVRPEKKAAPAPPEPAAETEVAASKSSTRGSRSASRGAGRGGRSHKEEARSTDREHSKNRDRPAANYPTRGSGSARGRGGKRQLPPRMDRQRHTRDGSDNSRPREQRNGGSYRRGSGGPSRRPQSKNNPATDNTSDHPILEPDWGEKRTENGSAGDSWAQKADSDSWGPNTDTQDSWGNKPTEQPDTETEAPNKSAESWPTESPKVESSSSSKPLVNGNAAEYNDLQYNSLTTMSDMSQRKRPAYTQAFSHSMTSSLSSILTSSAPDFSTPTSTVFSNSFPFSQAQTSEPTDFATRHEQATNFATRHEQATNDHGSNNLLKIQEALQKGNLAPGRKISVEQLFQMHEKPSSGSLTNVEERVSPSSPPTSSTSSTNSGKRSRRHQRTIPSEPVEMPSGTVPVVMPGNTIQSLDVQFGSIGFLDNTEEDDILEETKEKTPGRGARDTNTTTSKSDAATSTTPHSHVADNDLGSVVMPGIHQVGPLRGADTSSPEPVQQQQQTTTAPPNLPPPSLENIRTANNLITSLPSNEEEKIKEKVPQIQQHPQSLQQQQQQHPQVHHQQQQQQQQQQAHHHHHHHHQQQQQQQQAQSAVPQRGSAAGDYGEKANKSLPPGVSMYPHSSSHNIRSSALYSSNSSYENATQQQQQQQQQHSQMTYDMSRYYTGTNNNSFDHARDSSNNFTTSSQMPQHDQVHKQYSRGGGGGGGISEQHQQHQLQQHSQSIMSSASHQSPHVGAGITSGISSTTAAPTGLGTTAGYPPLMGHYYHPIPHHAYPNNLYAAAPNYYHHFNPVNFAAQTQAKQTPTAVPGYPGAAATFGNSETVSTGGSAQFAAYEDYKDMYAPTATKHPAHIPVTSSNEYNKMLSEKNNMFSLGYAMQFPNYLPQFQQSQSQPQAAAALMQQRAQQEQSRTAAGPSLTAQKHGYWAHR